MYPVFRKFFFSVRNDITFNSIKSVISSNQLTRCTQHSTSRVVRLLNAQRLDSPSFVENALQKKKKKKKRKRKCTQPVMTSMKEEVQLDDVDNKDELRNSLSLNLEPGNELVGIDPINCVLLPCDRNPLVYNSVMDQSSNSLDSIYNSDTHHLLNDIKEKLSWIRFTEYTNYGQELLRTDKLRSIQTEMFTVATYNVLCQELLEKHRYLYTDNDHRSLFWHIRSEILLEELKLLNADILCMQEVDWRLVDSFYSEFLNRRGYIGFFKKRTHENVDGCAIYYNKDKFDLIEARPVELYRESIPILSRDNIGILLKLCLKNRPETEFVIATTHLLFNLKRADVRLAQTQVMLAEIENFAYLGYNSMTGLSEYLPIIFTGDMNYSPESAIYQLVTKNQVVYEGMSSRYLQPVNDGFNLYKTLIPQSLGVTDHCQYLSSLSRRQSIPQIRFESGTLGHPLNLASVYHHVKKDLPEVTANQKKWVTVDYIFYSQVYDRQMEKREGRLKLVSKLTLPNVPEMETELQHIPNLACASDHLPLLARFHLVTP